MSREIKSLQDVTTPVTPAAAYNTNPPSDFKDRLVKLIPSEIVTAYITLQGLISSQPEKDKQLYTIIAVVALFLFTPFYLKKVSEVSKIGQIVFTSIAFLIWVMASGGFHNIFPKSVLFENDFLGSMLLLLYTLGIPLVYKG